jgi:Flp pilus assembly pilin Flp
LGLTPRELEIVSAVVAGYSNKEIAEYFKISEDTVKHHLSNIFDKLGRIYSAGVGSVCSEPIAATEKHEPVAKMFVKLKQNLWRDEQGQDIAEYAVMLAVILVIVVGTVKLIGTNASLVFSNVASSIQ